MDKVASPEVKKVEKPASRWVIVWRVLEPHLSHCSTCNVAIRHSERGEVTRSHCPHPSYEIAEARKDRYLRDYGADVLEFIRIEPA